jgi:hypothetical protein
MPLSRPRTIRVFILEPSGSISDTLQGRVEEVSLDDNLLEYDALSYVWGSVNKPSAIKSGDSSVIMVTENCEAALRHIRDAKTAKRVWVDAMCINQDSDAERSAQVSLMGEIYKKASCVYLWLGPATDADKKLFSVIRYVTPFCRWNVNRVSRATIRHWITNTIMSLIGAYQSRLANKKSIPRSSS